MISHLALSCEPAWPSWVGPEALDSLAFPAVVMRKPSVLSWLCPHALCLDLETTARLKHSLPIGFAVQLNSIQIAAMLLFYVWITSSGTLFPIQLQISWLGVCLSFTSAYVYMNKNKTPGDLYSFSSFSLSFLSFCFLYFSPFQVWLLSEKKTCKFLQCCTVPWPASARLVIYNIKSIFNSPASVQYR